MRHLLPDDEFSHLSLNSVPYVNLIADIVGSEAFQRLRDIKFLGAIDYLVSPNGKHGTRRHSRFEHSLGVAELAACFSQRLELPSRDERTLVVAALLHDIGHSPLSHSLESAFKGRFLLSHHLATEYVVRGVVSLGASLEQIFLNHGLDRDEILELISGRSLSVYGEAFRNPINIDTIDGIIRAYTYLSPGMKQLTPQRVVHALIDRTNQDVQILDEFWQLKNIVYQQLISSPSGVIADYICREYLTQNESRFSTELYFSTESDLRRKHPKLFRNLYVLRMWPERVRNGSESKISYKKRAFCINESVALEDFSSLYRRYTQDKHDELLTIAALSSFDEVFQSQVDVKPEDDLFPDRGPGEPKHSQFGKVFSGKAKRNS